MEQAVNKVVEIAANHWEKYKRELLDSSYQGVKKLFVLAYDNATGNNQVFIESFKTDFLPIVKIENCNFQIDGRNFYHQPINDSIKQYDEILEQSKETMLEFSKWITSFETTYKWLNIVK